MTTAPPTPALHPDDLLGWGRGWVAVSKPPGVSVHNDPGRDLCSITARYVAHRGSLARSLGYDPGFGFHPPHRLDKETSGVVLLACSAAALQWISRQFMEKRVAKRYTALVHGRLALPPDVQWGDWTWPLSKAAGGRKHPSGKGEKVPCRTRYGILRHTSRYTLIECEPVTGRKHQIRRHARMAGHAVVGDARYGTPQSIRHLKSMAFNRLALHALTITLVPPGTDRPVTLGSRRLPGDIIRMLDADADIARIIG
ncbi:MAG: RluA family pseudouridine synthase [Desulfococcus multivorans]|jgi:23S rRNA-/tRNA-specific pseudouridylate synthase|nr:RluA family pseudouridine synthase [Desulfococcus multivorans]